LNEESIPALRCRIVAGAANNQLGDPGDALALHERGILYAPDYVINGGGAMAFTSIYLGVEDLDEVESRVRSIGRRLSDIFAEAADRGSSPVVAAQAHVARVLQRGPS
jgi:leucine dehydrogenase